MVTVTVDKDKCDGDAVCVDICPMNVYDMVDDKAEPTRSDECIMCMACVNACPNQAITVDG
jgi:NAD-dependent dihydropyrimidine dehydrogenase PreA subunit